LSLLFKYNEEIHIYHGLGLKKCESYLTSETKAKKDFHFLLACLGNRFSLVIQQHGISTNNGAGFGALQILSGISVSDTT